jgi:hypothetical protein
MPTALPAVELRQHGDGLAQVAEVALQAEHPRSSNSSGCSPR